MSYPKVTLHYLFLSVILIVAGVGLYWGWRTFWFLTDDAYIFFRYISSSVLGYGYTWNLPPFRPVEGYTSFLWVVLLEVVWRITGVQPPESANAVSLFFAYGTTLLSIAMLLKVKLQPALNKMRLPLTLFALVGILTNRTYLTWTSSGLETALFNFLFTLWIFIGLFVHSATRRWSFSIILVSVLAALTRPDGLLLVATSILLTIFKLYVQFRSTGFSPRFFLPFTPLLALIAHFTWRRLYYGEWLPNTYAAKYVTAWPESGLRYWFSFTMEYALWFWLLLVLIFIVLGARQLFVSMRTWRITEWLTPATFGSKGVVQAGIIGTLLAHFFYYTFIIGGDYFEYRVYSHLIVLIFVSTIWLMNALRFKAIKALIFLNLFVFCSLPIPWMHWMLTHSLTTREQTFSLTMPVAPQFPAIVRPYVDLFDGAQSWLIAHGVCNRHQEHKVFALERADLYPDRERGLLLSPDAHPVFVAGAVGVISWRFPTVNIIDWLGLNDYVIARNPIDPTHTRYMAHDRFPPVGYAKCFQPNLKMIADNKFVIAQRETDAITTIQDCEDHAWSPRIEHPPDTEDSNTDNLNILLPAAADFEAYLWNVWPTDPSYIFFVPPTQKGIQALDPLRRAFTNYNGLGCMVLPSPNMAADVQNVPHYMFTFLSPQNRPPLSNVQALFPWTEIVTERYITEPFAYNLGYAAPIEENIEVIPDSPVWATWTNGVILQGYDLPQDTYAPGETIYLTLYYLTQAPLLDTDFNFFVHLSDAADLSASVLIGQDDGEICRGLYPSRFWQPGTIIANKVAVSLPVEMLPGEYQLRTGFYSWQTSARLHVVDVESVNGEEAVDVVTVRVQTR